MEFFEKDLEEIIFNADKEKLRKRGLNIKGKLYRQLKIGNYGIADLIEVRKCYDQKQYANNIHDPILIITVYELKKETIGVSAFFQSINYLKGIMSYMNTYYPNMNIHYRIKLIGKNIDTSGSMIYLTDMIYNSVYNSLNTIDYYLYKYNEEGIEFHQQNEFALKDEGF